MGDNSIDIYEETDISFDEDSRTFYSDDGSVYDECGNYLYNSQED